MTVNQPNIFTVIEATIRALARERGMSLKDLVTEIDLTEAGFYQMLKSESMKIKTLIKIADSLNSPVHVFFEGGKTFQAITGDNNNQNAHSFNVAEPQIPYQKNEVESLKKQISLLEAMVADKEKIIELITKK